MSRSEGVLPLAARLEPWMEQLVADPDQCADLVARWGSPVNVHDFGALARNAGDLVGPAYDRGVRARVFVARKANKTLGLVDAARAAGLGLDVASLGELEQSLARGYDPADLVLSAAVKSPALLARCVRDGVLVSLDNTDEASLLLEIARSVSGRVRVALRLAVVAPDVAPTRFGLPAEGWLSWWEGLAVPDRDLLAVEGIHFHLNGYAAPERRTALRAAVDLVGALRERGVAPSFIDMGGGVPMSYLLHERQWRDFWRAVDGQENDEVTWRGDRLGLVDPSAARPSPTTYPYWQTPVRGAWLAEVLDAAAGPGRHGSVADLLREADLELRLEPGRAVLDGCGLTLASVAFRKSTSDGVPLVGLHMNRTQVRSTSADFLVDPLLVRPGGADPGPPVDGFLVGAYCIEEELLLRRRLRFPDGVALTDLVAFPNTGGYLMHIVESASHQIPLARNVVAGPYGWVLDALDGPDAN
ncbi:MAG: alanine racemase [Nocardioides sp.]|uniref:alanine racemase n=1 Tax=Nocardioides sp. TaxID=35761 RepID=UPI003F01B4FF